MFSFVSRDENSSVYSALGKYLEASIDWTKCQNEGSCKFHLMFGERNFLKFARLGQEPGYNHLVNYYRGSSILCKKASLKKTLDEFNVGHCISKSSWLPQTFVVYPPEIKVNDDVGRFNLRELKAKARAEKDERKMLENVMNNTGGLWIAKSTNGAKGDGIFITNNYDDIVRNIDQQSVVHVVQKYIEDPLLLPGDRKFDIRCWVLLDHEYQIHLFKDGVLRTASDPYTPSDTSYSKVTSHLTNHCLQEALSHNYGKYEQGNEMFFDEFDRFLQERHKISLQEKLIPQIKNIIRTSLLAVKERLHTRDLPYKSFQLFGFDFMVDVSMNVWLIEVNGAPACAQQLLSSLIASMKKTAIDTVFQPTQCHDDHGLFELIDSPS